MVNHVHQSGVRDTENLSTMTEHPGISSPTTDLCHPCHHQKRKYFLELTHLLRRVSVFSSRGKPNIYLSHLVTQMKSIPVKTVLTNIRNWFEESQSIMLTLTQMKSIPVKTVLTNIRNWFEESQSIMLTVRPPQDFSWVKFWEDSMKILSDETINWSPPTSPPPPHTHTHTCICKKNKPIHIQKIP